MTPGASIVGPALSLQFMPLLEDLYPANAEYVAPAVQLHRHVDIWLDRAAARNLG
jgi:hypothetical protein